MAAATNTGTYKRRLAAALVGDGCDRSGDELSMHRMSTASSFMVLLIIE